jgi:predicted DNA-binding transcriptional regulator AlpA
MLKTTKLIIENALISDPSTQDRVQEVLRVLNSPCYIPELISEPRAAEILGISQSGLYKWRTENKNSIKFPFRVRKHPIALSSVHYDAAELRLYLNNITLKE